MSKIIFDNNVDDDVALTPIELMEGLNANHAMGSELEAVEDESAWEPQELTTIDSAAHPLSFDSLSSMTESELAQYLGNSIRNALKTRIPGGDKQVTRRRKKKGPILLPIKLNHSLNKNNSRRSVDIQPRHNKKPIHRPKDQEEDPKGLKTKPRQPLRFLEIKTLACS
jgi:hypothetical protein